MNKKHLFQMTDAALPELVLNFGWIDEITHITNENIRITSNGGECILLNSDFEGWSGFVILNFSCN